MTRQFDFPPPKLVVFSGNMRRPSHARALGEYLARRLGTLLPVTTVVHDVLEAGPGLGSAFTRQELSPSAGAVLKDIENADALIAVSPIYNGAYTGLFKHMFDFVDPLSLVDRPVLVAATGGGHRHALAVEHQLRPLFGFFSALTVPTAVYASDSEFEAGQPADPIVLARAQQAVGQLAALLALRQSQRREALLVAPPLQPGGSGGLA